jgi:hypothetical protein
MKVSAWDKCRGIALGLTVCYILASPAQTATHKTTNPQTINHQITSQSPVTASNPSVFALDVIAQDAKTTAILPRLGREDFQVTDNGREVPIEQLYEWLCIRAWL